MCYLYLFYYISFIVASHACTEMHRKEFMYCKKPQKNPKKTHLHSLWATFAFLLLLKKQNKQKHPFCT